MNNKTIEVLTCGLMSLKSENLGKFLVLANGVLSIDPEIRYFNINKEMVQEAVTMTPQADIEDLVCGLFNARGGFEYV